MQEIDAPARHGGAIAAATYLLVVPLLSAVLPWLTLGTAYRDPATNSASPWVMPTAVYLPALGAASVLVGRLRDYCLAKPLVGFLVVAAAWVATGTALIAIPNGAELEFDTLWYGDLQDAWLGCMVLLPFFALVGGLRALYRTQRP